MPRTKVTFDLVREIGLALSDVAVGTMYGSPALKVRGRLLTCLAINKSAEPDSLVVAIDFDQRSGMLADAPETYYLTDHYADYPVVLVRLSQIRNDELRHTRMENVIRNWTYNDAQSAEAWVKDSPLSPEEREQLLTVISDAQKAAAEANAEQ